MPIRRILQADIVRMTATKPENTSLAAAYFKQRPMHNSTHIAASKIKKEIGNIPVVGRGGPGVRPKHGAETILIEPMPIEIDDTISAVDMDNYERSTELGKNQIIDEFTGEHYDMVRETMNALCCQAHRGKIDYMMKSEGGLQRYVVEFGTSAEISAMKEKSSTLKLSAATYADFVKILTGLSLKLKKNGVGGPVEFIAASNVYAKMLDAVAAKPNLAARIDGESLMVGQFKVFCDNDSYINVDSSGQKTTKSLCDDGEILCRALNAGQSMPFCKLDDTIQQNATPFYTFTVERQDHRGTDIYSKSKPLPLVNIRGIAWFEFLAE
ncbi:major capsid protein [Treponema pectinovorum]|uniref:major capsid protein n=1 Tax=Treponema pectinovorum TaxID=164 RepID=UPI0011C7AC2F|nr:major capsid protein [Treponema pectinovorum]